MISISTFRLWVTQAVGFIFSARLQYVPTHTHTLTLLTMVTACTQNAMHIYFTVAHIAKYPYLIFPFIGVQPFFPFICSHSHIEIVVCCRHKHTMIWARLRYYICIFIVIALQANAFCLFHSSGWSCIYSKISLSIRLASLQLVHYHNDLKAKHNVTSQFCFFLFQPKIPVNWMQFHNIKTKSQCVRCFCFNKHIITRRINEIHLSRSDLFQET